jgi:hypothetical protein
LRTFVWRHFKASLVDPGRFRSVSSLAGPFHAKIRPFPRPQVPPARVALGRRVGAVGVAEGRTMAFPAGHDPCPRPRQAGSVIRGVGASIEGQPPPTVATVTRRQRLDGARTRRRGHPPEVSDRFERGLMVFGKPREGGAVSEARRGRSRGRRQGDFRGLSGRCSRPCSTLTRPPNAAPAPPRRPIVLG